MRRALYLVAGAAVGSTLGVLFVLGGRRRGDDDLLEPDEGPFDTWPYRDGFEPGVAVGVHDLCLHDNVLPIHSHASTVA